MTRSDLETIRARVLAAAAEDGVSASIDILSNTEMECVRSHGRVVYLLVNDDDEATVGIGRRRESDGNFTALQEWFPCDVDDASCVFALAIGRADNAVLMRGAR